MATEVSEVERILSRDNNKYLVKWAGYPLSSSTWEPEDHLDNCKKKMEEFKKTGVLMVKESDDLNEVFIPQRIIGQTIKNDEKKNRREMFYEVQWPVFPNQHTTFEPRNTMLNHKEVINKYETERKRLEDVEDDDDCVMIDFGLGNDVYEDIGRGFLPRIKDVNELFP